MLIPPPEADLSESLLVRGADILDLLTKHGEETVVEEIMLDYLKCRPKSDADAFMDSLTLLYALGLIEYEHFRIRRRSTP